MGGQVPYGLDRSTKLAEKVTLSLQKSLDFLSLASELERFPSFYLTHESACTALSFYMLGRVASTKAVLISSLFFLVPDQAKLTKLWCRKIKVI